MNDDLIPRDTTPDAARKQHEIFRSMSIEDRANLTFELSDRVKQITLAGIRHRHPDYDEKQVRQAWHYMILDRKTYNDLYKNSEIRP
jgi:hypothetical protein